MYADWESKLNEELTPLLNKEVDSSHHSSPFYRTMGDLFAALEKNPEAIWAYQKALRVNPWDTGVKPKLEALQTKLLLPSETSFSIPQPWLYQLFTLLFIFLILTFKYRLLRKILGIATSLVLLTIAYNAWVEPTYAILLHSTYLYSAPTELAVSISPIPVPSGSKIIVLDTEKKGHWLKIKDIDGRIGYVSHTTLRIL